MRIGLLKREGAGMRRSYYWIFLMTLVLLVLLLYWFIAPTTPTERKDFALAAAQVVGGAAFFFSLYFAWRTLEINRQTLQLNQDRQVTERFTKAIDQLGSEKLQIRLGGIYALGRIARESVTDSGAIVEVLTAYVRENTPWPPTSDRATDPPFTTRVAGIHPSGRRMTPPPDIQAILTVLGRHSGDDMCIDLHGTDLRGADLQRANLAGAKLEEANLEGANLEGANLEAADLSNACLVRAKLGLAKLAGAFLEGTDLQDAMLEAADLQGAWLARVQLQGASLVGANLDRAQLNQAILDAATLEGARGLTQGQIDLAIITERNKCPVDTPPPH